jgi:hypothetical protein
MPTLSFVRINFFRMYLFDSIFRLRITSVRLIRAKASCFCINYKVNKENSALTQIHTTQRISAVAVDKTYVLIIENEASIYQMNKDLVDASNDTSTFEESLENTTAYFTTANSFFYWGKEKLIQQAIIRDTTTLTQKNVP